MTAVEVNGVAGKKPSHEGCKASSGAKQEVKMVGHQRPGKAFGVGFQQKFRKALEKAQAVIVIAEDVATVHATDDNVLQKVR